MRGLRVDSDPVRRLRQGLALLALLCMMGAVAPLGAAPAVADLLGYSANRGDGTLTPIDLTTGVASAPISVGSGPASLALTPGGNMLLVADSGADSVTPVTIAGGASGNPSYSVGKPIPAGSRPEAIAITADGMTAYVADDGSDTVTPITLNGVLTAGTPLKVAPGPNAIALTPNGELAYITSDSGWVTPIITATNHLTRTPPPIRVGSNPDAIVISPDGSSGYVTDSTGGAITRFKIPSDTVQTPINVGATPDALAISPGGQTMWVADNIAAPGQPAQYALTSISPSTGTVGGSIMLGAQPSAIAISPDGATAYVSEYSSNQVVPVTLPAGPVGAPIPVGANPSALVLSPLGGLTGVGGSGGGVAGDPPGYIFPISVHQRGTFGNQQLSVHVSGTTTSPTAECLVPRGFVRVHVSARRLKHGRRLHLMSVAFTLGRHHRQVRRLPATVRLSLAGLGAGSQTVVVRMRYREAARRPAHAARNAAGRPHRGRLITKTLRSRITIC